MIATTVFTPINDSYSFDELMNQNGEMLPDREELCCIPVGNCAHIVCQPIQHCQPQQQWCHPTQCRPRW